MKKEQLKRCAAFLKRAAYGKLLFTLAFQALIIICVPLVMPGVWGWVCSAVLALLVLMSLGLFWVTGWAAEKLWGCLWKETKSGKRSRGRSGR